MVALADLTETAPKSLVNPRVRQAGIDVRGRKKRAGMMPALFS